MIFESWTGSLRLGGFDLVVSPVLSRDAFEVHRDASRFDVLVRNEPYCSYVTRCSIEGEPFHVTLWFRDRGPIWRLSLGTARSEIVGKDWGDYNLSASVDFHERWLDEALGLRHDGHPAFEPRRPYRSRPRRQPWGSAAVGVDHHNQTSEIFVTYRDDPRPAP